MQCTVFPGGRLGGLLSEKRAGDTLAWLCPVATCHVLCIHSCKVVPCLLTDSPHSLVISYHIPPLPQSFLHCCCNSLLAVSMHDARTFDSCCRERSVRSSLALTSKTTSRVLRWDLSREMQKYIIDTYLIVLRCFSTCVQSCCHKSRCVCSARIHANQFNHLEYM